MTTMLSYSNGASTKARVASFDRARATMQPMPLTRNGAVLTGRWPDGRFLMGYDMDVKEGETLGIEDIHPVLRDTFLVRTGRGGMHAFVFIENVRVGARTTGTFVNDDDIEIIHPKLDEFTMKGDNQIMFAAGTKLDEHASPYVIVRDTEPITIDWDTHVGILQSHVRQKTRVRTGRLHRDRDAEVLDLLDRIDLPASMDAALERMGAAPNRWQCRDGNTTAPSVLYYPDSDSFYCHKCRIGGDAIAFHAYSNRISNATSFQRLMRQHAIPPVVVDEAGARVETREPVEARVPGFTVPIIPVPASDKNPVVISTIANAISPVLGWVGGDKGFWVHVDEPRCQRIEDIDIERWIAPTLEGIEKYSPAMVKTILSYARATCRPIAPLELNDSRRFGNAVCFSNGWMVFSRDGQPPAWCPPLPGYLTTCWIPHEFDSTAHEPAVFQSFLRRFTRDDDDRARRFIEWIGYCMMPGNPFKRALMIIGESNSGKSVYLDMVAAVLGRDNSTTIELQQLCAGMASGFALSDLDGKLFCRGSEIAGTEKATMSFADTEAIKSLTDGLATATIMEKFKARREAWKTAKLAYGTNDYPTTAANVVELEVFMNRWWLERAGEPWDGEMTDMVAAIQPDIPGIIRLAVVALTGMMARGRVEDDEECRLEWRIKIDPLRAFVDAECDRVRGRIPVEEFHDRLIEWLETHRVTREYSRTAITQRLQNIGVSKIDTGARADPRYWYSGITWRDDPAETDSLPVGYAIRTPTMSIAHAISTMIPCHVNEIVAATGATRGEVLSHVHQLEGAGLVILREMVIQSV